MRKIIIVLLSSLSIAYAAGFEPDTIVTANYKRCLLSYKKISESIFIGYSQGFGLLTCKGTNKKFPVILQGLNLGIQMGTHVRKGCIELKNVRIENGYWDSTSISFGAEVGAYASGSLSGGVVLDDESSSLNTDGISETGHGVGGGIAGGFNFIEIVEDADSNFWKDVADANLYSCSYN